MKELFIELINDKTKTPEEIYNIMFEKYKEFYSTKKILRGRISWDNSIYQGTIGEKDFIVSEASSTALDRKLNIRMINDNYKNSIIKFIELFRKAYEENPDMNIISLIKMISPKLLAEIFEGASRNDELATKQRNSSSSFNQEVQMREYNISSRIGKGKSAICCERNVTIGNVFQFVGIETLHVTGFLTVPKEDEDYTCENHAFTLIKYGEGVGKYALFDTYNGVFLANVLPGDYDFSKGFKIEYNSDKIRLIYEVTGPLYEINDEILKTEAYIRKLSGELERIEVEFNKNNFSEESILESLKQEFEGLILTIRSSTMNEVLKERYITRIESFYLKKISKLNIVLKNKAEENSVS